MCSVLKPTAISFHSKTIQLSAKRKLQFQMKKEENFLSPSYNETSNNITLECCHYEIYEKQRENTRVFYFPRDKEE